MSPYGQAPLSGVFALQRPPKYSFRVPVLSFAFLLPDMSCSDMNCSVMLFILQLGESKKFNSTFKPLQLLVNRVLQWVRTADLPVARDMMAKMEEKATPRRAALKKSQLLRDPSLRLRELGTEQIR